MTSPSDVFRTSVYSILSNCHTAMPGIVTAYNASTNKATIQPALNKAFLSGEKPLPILENVPIMFSGGSDFTITFPIRPGDYVLLIFCERSIDLWKSEGGQVTPDDPRKFHLSDAIAIPGLQPFNGDFTNRNNQDFTINFAGSSIIINPNGDILIETSNKVAIGTSTNELLKIVSDLLLSLQNSVTTTVGAPIQGGGPLMTYANLRAQIEAIRGTI